MIVDTMGLFEAGTGYTFECSTVPEEITRKGYVFWQFNFETKSKDGRMILNYSESVPIWLCGPVFKALGFPEVSAGRFDVEPTLALGRSFKCDVVHEDVNGTARARMKNMIPVTSEQPKLGKKEEEDIPF